jgi:hypothetical protein
MASLFVICESSQARKRRRGGRESLRGVFWILHWARRKYCSSTSWTKASFEVKCFVKDAGRAHQAEVRAGAEPLIASLMAAFSYSFVPPSTPMI